MKFVLSLVTLFLVAAMAYSYPAELNLQQQLGDSLWQPAGEITEEHLARSKRATCELFSFQTPWFTPNHAACAAHCLFLGYNGGRCLGTVCLCIK